MLRNVQKGESLRMESPAIDSVQCASLWPLFSVIAVTAVADSENGERYNSLQLCALKALV